jgi:superfamily II DNA or RNA helicase
VSVAEVESPAPKQLPAHVLEAAAAAGGVTTTVLTRAVEVALAGGPDDAAPGWTNLADCRGLDPNEYFPGHGVQRSATLLRKACQHCPVQAECLGAALSGGERSGTWGGTSGAARARLRAVLRDAGVMGVTGEAAYLAWLEEGADREPAAEKPAHLRALPKPWPHQVEAVKAITRNLAGGGACQVAIATASGKTLVGAWAATSLEADQVVVLVPNLALVAQTYEAWLADPRWAGARFLAVCSDTGELELEATTDPFRVLEFLDGGGPAVVLATYQSSPVLVEAAARVDLVIADEAHHLAGERDKAYAAVVRGEIPTERTLYMTATPRRFHKRKSDVDLVSMDDEDFGPRAFELTLADAVAAGVVADYRVVVAAVEREVFDRVARHPDLADVDPHLLAGAVAVVRAMGEFGLKSCLSFHTRVERARSFARLIGPVAEALPNLRPAGPGWAGFVHGQASVRIRRRLLGRLADGHTWGVLANAKALGEGVDIPVLDAVAIVDPKNSETDVLQATGRALRRPSGSDKVGTVLLPVLLNGEADPEDPFANLDPRSMEVVSGVLRALRSHDAELSSRLDNARRTLGRSKGHPNLPSRAASRQAARALLHSRIELWVPGGATGDLAGAISLQLVRESTSSWDESFGRLEVYAEEHGHARPPSSEKTMASNGATSWTLGAWCSRQRTLYRRGLLGQERVEQLEALPGWRWDPRDEGWWEAYDALTDYLERHEGAYPRQRREVLWRGIRIGQWVNEMRTAFNTAGKGHSSGWLMQFPERIAALERLPGWVWNIRDAEWEESFARLQRWVALAGHAAPRVGDLVDGVDVGKWVTKQRSRISGSEYFDRRLGRSRVEKLSDDRVARLRALPGWVDDARKNMWEEGYEHLVTWAADGGAEMPVQSVVTGDGFPLGAWVSTQRIRWRDGRISKARAERLEAMPFWQWTSRPQVGTSRHADWLRSYEEFQAWATDTGNADPFSTQRGPSGFCLGRWVIEQRLRHRAGRLSDERVQLLEAVPGWVWQSGREQRAET